MEATRQGEGRARGCVLLIPADLFQAAEREVERPAGHVGTIIAVVPESRTLVVDIPLRKDVLRVGAVVTARTKIEAAGKRASLESLKPGDRVRINFRRTATGDEAVSVEVLRGAKG